MEMLKLILIATIRESSEVFLKGFEIIKLTLNQRIFSNKDFRGWQLF